MMKIISLFVLLFTAHTSFSKEQVSFFTTDSLKITADLYMKDLRFPFIILFHQAGSSRGEFVEIAPKLLNLNYNCLAVDLRSGGKVNYVVNETAERAQKQGLPNAFLDARQDILASMEFVHRYNKKPIILFGSSYSASLSLLVANSETDILAVVAYSPGEFFRPNLMLQDELKGFDKPAFVSSTEMESKYIAQLFTNANKSQMNFYKPDSGRGVHGAKALWESSEQSRDSWLALSQFFNKLKSFY